MSLVRRRRGLRRTTRIGTQSTKEGERQKVWRKVKAAVRTRSGGRCEARLTREEVTDLYRRGLLDGHVVSFVRQICPPPPAWEAELYRCENEGTDAAHVRKPRNQHHHVECVLWLCRNCHNWMDFGVPSDKRGRLMAAPTVACRRDDPASAGGCPPEAHPNGDVAPRTWVTRETKWERRSR